HPSQFCSGWTFGSIDFLGRRHWPEWPPLRSGPKYAALGPPLGITYQIAPKMVLRAFYGIYHWPTNTILFQGRWMPNTGWGAILTRTSLVNGVTATFANWDNGTFTLPTMPNVDPTLLNGSGVVYVDRNSKGLYTALDSA